MDKMRIHEMLEKMTEWSLSEMQAKGKEGVDTKEMGEVIDMVKDLAEAEKAVWEKCYYESIVEAMKEAEEEAKHMGMTRAGYDRWRTSSGRFAPKGTGHETSMRTATGRAGFDYPYPGPYYPDIDNPDIWMNRMGFPDGHPGERTDMGDRKSPSATGRAGYSPDGDWGMQREPSRYDKYKDSRRHYTDVRTPEAKNQMDGDAKRYMEEAAVTMKEIWKDADPQMQKQMKENLFQLGREFGIM